jgi:predicted TIM-barrel fold metal-dependent hydrolase
MLDNKSRVVDLHYHLHSPGLARAVAASVLSFARIDKDYNFPLIVDGKKMPTPAEEEILAEADRLGVDIVVLSVQRFNWVFQGKMPDSPEAFVSMSQAANEYLSSVCRRFPGRFMALADIPDLRLGQAAVDEMKRALNRLGLYGIRLWTSYAGKYLDAPEFLPFFEEANRLRAVLCTHPVAPPDAATSDYHMYSVVKLPYDTTLSIARLAYSGVLEICPDIKLVVSHAGGTIPFLWWRIDYGYLENYSNCRSRISKAPTEYLKSCYYDTALCDAETLNMASKRVGTDHLLLGSDSPYHTRALEETLKAVKAMKVTAKAKTQIAGANALTLSNGCFQ